MRLRIGKALLAAAAVTAFAMLPSCGLFRATADGVMDDGEDAIASDWTAADIDTAEFMYEFGEDGATAQIRFKSPDRIRIDVLDGTRTVVFCLTKASGWMFVRGEVINMTAEDIAEMHVALLQAIPFRVNFQDLFGNTALEEETEFAAGEECYVIHGNFRRDPKYPVTLWFGKKSELLRQFEVDRDDGKHTIQYFDYRGFDDSGVVLPARMFKFSDNGSTKMTLNSFEANVDIPDYVFRKPDKLSALEGDKR